MCWCLIMCLKVMERRNMLLSKVFVFDNYLICIYFQVYMYVYVYVVSLINVLYIGCMQLVNMKFKILNKFEKKINQFFLFDFVDLNYYLLVEWLIVL